MGFLDRFRKNKVVDKALDAAEGAGDKIAQGVDKATDMIDEKTGGKYTDKLDKVDEAAQKLADKAQDATDAAEGETDTGGTATS